MRGSDFRTHQFGRWTTLAALLVGSSVGCKGSISGPSTEPGSAPPATGNQGTGTGSTTTGGSTTTAGGSGATTSGASQTGGTQTAGTQPGNSSTPGGATAAGGGAQALPPSLPSVEPPRRLSLTEYKNTIRDLLGMTTPVTTDDLPVDQQAGTSGFLTGAAITSAPDARLLLDKSDAMTTAAMSSLATQVPCIATPTAADTCAKQFITTFGRRAFRRPLVDDEVTRLMALYTLQMGPTIGSTFSEAIRGVTMAMIQSPNFLYRWELGPTTPAIKDGTLGGTLIRFNSQEMASRLSYAFWATMPDARLFQLADADQLQTPDQIQQEVRRMIIDPKAKDAYGDFATQWLSLSQLPSALKDASLNFTPQVAQSMLAETGAFVSDLFLGAKATGSLTDLLTSQKSFVDGTLAKIYGISGVTGTALQQVTFPAGQRAGILTQASFQTMHGDVDGSFPVRRGAQVYRRLFCKEVNLPDNVQVVPPPPATAGQTTRQRFAQHAMNPCAGCHALFEPIGFAFENYDGLGGYRTTDNGQPVDASGSLTIGTTPVTFKSAIDLAGDLAQNDQVRDCVATQWMRYVLRRREGDGDLASLQKAETAFRAASFDMRELLVSIASTDAFSHRSPAPGEVLQ
jgi:hypothetical protein